DVDVIGAELLAEAIEIRSDGLGGGGVRFGEDDDLVARDGLQRLAHVGVTAILVGRIPEVDALIEAGAKKFGEAFVAELAGLVGAASAAVRSGAERETAQFDFARTE